jgi:hypothetical protein
MKKQWFQINEPLEMNGKFFNINAEGTIYQYPGSYLEPGETLIDYDYLKINNQDISLLENDMFKILTFNIDPYILELIETKYPSLEKV